MKKKWIFGVFILMFLFIVGGCSESNEPVSKPDPETDRNDVETENDRNPEEPITITIAHPFGDDIFQNRYGTIQEKLPHINLEMVYYDNTAAGLEELFASDIVPDIFNAGNVELLQEYDAVIPIDELSEKHGFDKSIIQPSLVAFLESFDDEGRMIGIPDGASYYALFYNKEIFDLFGVPYPDQENPMTWDEVLELSRKLTGERNGTQYVGLEFHNNDFTAPINQFAINLTDPETGEVLVSQKPEIKKYFDMIENFYSIPSMKDEEVIAACMFCEKRAAMSIAWHGLFLWGWGDDPETVEHIDIAPIPVWPELPNTGPYLLSWPIMVSAYSEHPDEAFQVLMEYVSEENQLRMASTVSAGPTALYPNVLQSLGAAHPFYDGKNVSALFQLEPAIGEHRQSAKWDAHVNLAAAREKLALTDIDVPTLIRELQEESEAKIKEAMEKE